MYVEKLDELRKQGDPIVVSIPSPPPSAPYVSVHEKYDDRSHVYVFIIRSSSSGIEALQGIAIRY